MAVTNTFERFLSHATNSGYTDLIPGNVPTNTDMVVMGLIVTNTYDSPSNTPITIDILFFDGSETFSLLKSTKVPEGEAMVAIGWDQKLVLKPGDNIRVRTQNASETADVALSVLKIVTA